MTPEEILSYPARVLTQAQRENYFERGYVGVESLVPQGGGLRIHAKQVNLIECDQNLRNPSIVF